MTTPFSKNNPPTELEKEMGSYLDPRENNTENFRTGQKVSVKMTGSTRFGQETRKGFVAKQVDDRHFLVKLDFPFEKINPGKSWIKVCRDYAHQSLEII
jgi:hypothetical protein